MKIFIGADHGGLEVKEEVKNFLSTQPGFEVEDMGANSSNIEDDYVLFAQKVAEKVLTENSYGILICRSGVGMSITANKYRNIYAALSFSPAHAEAARKHNNANILCLDADYQDHLEILEIVQVFINTPFSNEDRHIRRINQIKRIEEINFK